MELHICFLFVMAFSCGSISSLDTMSTRPNPIKYEYDRRWDAIHAQCLPHRTSNGTVNDIHTYIRIATPPFSISPSGSREQRKRQNGKKLSKTRNVYSRITHTHSTTMCVKLTLAKALNVGEPPSKPFFIFFLSFFFASNFGILFTSFAWKHLGISWLFCYRFFSLAAPLSLFRHFLLHSALRGRIQSK